MHLELQPVMTSYGARGPGRGGLQGVWSTPIPSKPPELLPQVINALAEVHLRTYKVGQVSQDCSCTLLECLKAILSGSVLLCQ